MRLPYADFAKPGVRVPARDDHRDRSRGAARHHRRRRRTRPTSSSSRSVPTTTSTRRPGSPGRERVLLGRRSRAAARRAPGVHERPRDRRRVRRAVQVPAGAERGGAAPARLPLRARVARRLRDLARHAVRDARPAVAGHVGCAARGVRRARDRVRPRPAGRRRSTRRAGSSCSTTARSCRTTCSSACRSTALRESCSRAGWPWTATSRSTRATLETRFPNVYAVGDVATVGVPKAGVFSERAARVVAEAIVARRLGGEPPRRLRRTRVLLHRVRCRPCRPRRRRLPLGPEADRHVPRSRRRARRGEAALRREPPRPLVRRLARSFGRRGGSSTGRSRRSAGACSSTGRRASLAGSSSDSGLDADDAMLVGSGSPRTMKPSPRVRP